MFEFGCADTGKGMSEKFQQHMFEPFSQEENGARRWSRIFKICKKYLTHIQNSVFEGELSKGQLAQLQKELKEYIDKELDSVIIFKSRQEKWLDKEFWGRKDDLTSFIL